jgi:hypothetical protein
MTAIARPGRVFAVRDAGRLGIAAAIAVALGVLTAYGQHWLPDDVGSLANSAGPWVVVAFTLAWRATTRALAAATGAIALVTLLGGYVLGAETRGLSLSLTTSTMWAVAALAVGPPVGISAHWLRHRDRRLAPVGAGAVAGLLVGEGIYGLSVIGDTTSAPYWIAHLVASVAFLAVAIARRAPTLRALSVACGTAAVIAAGFVISYERASVLLLLLH